MRLSVFILALVTSLSLMANNDVDISGNYSHSASVCPGNDEPLNFMHSLYELRRNNLYIRGNAFIHSVKFAGFGLRCTVNAGGLIKITNMEAGQAEVMADVPLPRTLKYSEEYTQIFDDIYSSESKLTHKVRQHRGLLKTENFLGCKCVWAANRRIQSKKGCELVHLMCLHQSILPIILLS